MAISTKILDHIPHLTPPGTLQESVDAFHELGFTVIAGGTHAGGATANALVVLADGTYLELIHFVRPPPADSPNPWARKRPGWIDYAFLGTGAPSGSARSVARAINARAKDEGTDGLVRYEESAGGRRREDGKVLEWVISSVPAEDERERGKLPFFCGDVTPREWRVPLEPASNTRHENTALGIAYIKLLVSSPEDLDMSTKQLTTVLGAPPSQSSTAKQAIWQLDGQPEASHSGVPEIILGVAQGDEERGYVAEHGPGIYEVGFVVADRGKVGVAKTPYGKLVWKTGSGHAR